MPAPVSLGPENVSCVSTGVLWQYVLDPEEIAFSNHIDGFQVTFFPLIDFGIEADTFA